MIKSRNKEIILHLDPGLCREVCLAGLGRECKHLNREGLSKDSGPYHVSSLSHNLAFIVKLFYEP